MMKRFNLSQKYIFVASFVVTLCLSFLVFGSSLSVGFLSDDFHMLSLTETQSLSLGEYFTTNLEGTQVGSSYGPVFRLWWRGMYAVAGDNATIYHMAIVFLHALASWLVGVLAWQISRRQWVSVASSLVFLTLHARAEAVSWVASFPHVFGTVCVLGAVALFLVGIRGNQRYFLYALLAWLFGLFTKEIAITVPVIWLLIIFVHYTAWQARLLTALRQLTIPAVIVVSYLVLRANATGQLGGYYASESSFSPLATVQSLLDVIIGTWLPVLYRAPIVEMVMVHPVGLLLVALALIIYLKQTNSRQAALYFVFVGIAVLPFTQIALHPLTQEGERYVYLVSAFLVPGTLLLLFQLITHQRHQRLLVATLILVQLMWLMPKLGDWQQAGIRTARLLDSVHALELHSYDQITLVGLPDHYLGAQMLRNAAGEALTREATKELRFRERIPQYSQEIGIYAGLQAVEQTSSTALLMGSVTGFPVWDGEYSRSTITGFTQPGHQGNGIEISLNTNAIQDNVVFHGQQYVMLYYDGQVLRELLRVY